MEQDPAQVSLCVPRSRCHQLCPSCSHRHPGSGSTGTTIDLDAQQHDSLRGCIVTFISNPALLCFATSFRDTVDQPWQDPKQPRADSLLSFYMSLYLPEPCHPAQIWFIHTITRKATPGNKPKGTLLPPTLAGCPGSPQLGSSGFPVVPPALPTGHPNPPGGAGPSAPS